MSKRSVSNRDRFMKFYPSDHRGDDELQSCSLAARGAWMELQCLAFKYDGIVLIAGEIPPVEELAKQIKATKTETIKVIAELERKGVVSRREDGALFSRRMVRDAHKRAVNKANGDKGGNPLLFDLDKRPDSDSVGRPVDQSVNRNRNRTPNPHGSPESRDQNPEPRTQDAQGSRSTDRDDIEPAWRPSEPRPSTLVEPRAIHGKCYDAPQACARGLCVPRFLGTQWEAQARSGQPDDFSASGYVIAFVNAALKFAIGPVGEDPLKWWRRQWEDKHRAAPRAAGSSKLYSPTEIRNAARTLGHGSWAAECVRLHDARCGGPNAHAEQMAAEDALAVAAGEPV